MSYSATVWTGQERLTLIRRTYALVFFSILLTMVGAAFAMTQPWLLESVKAHPGMTMLSTFIPLIAVQFLRDRFPLNIALVCLFAFAMGVMLGWPLLLYNQTQPGILLQAGGLTLSTFVVISVYAFVSRRDFSALGGFFVTGLWVLIATSLLNLFFQNATANLWIAAGTVLIFSGLLLFDTWRLVRGGVFGPNDYVRAAVQIYLDLLNIFMGILSLLGGNRR